MVNKNISRKNIIINLGTVKKRGRPRKKQEPKEVIIKEVLPSQKFSRKENKALDQLLEANREKEKAQLEKGLIELVKMRGGGIPPFFAVPTIKGWKLANPLTLKKSKIDMTIPRNIPTLQDFSLKDQGKLKAYMKAVEEGTEEEYLYKNKPKGFPADLYKSAKKEISGGSLSVKDLKSLLGASFDPKQDKVNNFDMDKEISSPTSKVYVNKITGQVVVAHMGTKGIIDWGNNAIYAYGGDWAYKQTNRYKEAKKVQDKAEKKYGSSKVSTIGYSQGGLQAELLGNKSKEIITYNKATRPLSNRRNKNQYDIRTSRDIVSGLNPFQTNNKKEIEIQSKTYNPITEHSRKGLEELDEDQIIGNGLEEYDKLLSNYNNIMPSQGGRMLGSTKHAVLPAHAGHPALMSDQYPRIPQSFSQIHLSHPVPIGGRGMCGGMIHEGVEYYEPAPNIQPTNFMERKIDEIVNEKIRTNELTEAMGLKVRQKAKALSHHSAGINQMNSPAEAVRKAIEMLMALVGGRMEGGRTYAQRLAARTRRTFAPVEKLATKTFTPQLGRDITSGLIHKALPAVISGIAGSATTLATGNPYLGFAVGQTAGKYAGKKAGDELGKTTGFGLMKKPKMVKGSKEMKDYMASIRAMKK